MACRNPKIFMLNQAKFVSLVSISGFLLTCLPASASYVYVNGWGMQGSAQSCIDNGKRVAAKLDFKLDQDTAWDDTSMTSGSLFATYKGFTDVSLNYRCDSNTGVMSFGISGPSNDRTFELYSDFFNAL